MKRSPTQADGWRYYAKTTNLTQWYEAKVADFQRFMWVRLCEIDSDPGPWEARDDNEALLIRVGYFPTDAHGNPVEWVEERERP